MCYEWAIISKAKGRDRETWIEKPIKTSKMKNKKNKHMEAKALQTI